MALSASQKGKTLRPWKGCHRKKKMSFPQTLSSLFCPTGKSTFLYQTKMATMTVPDDEQQPYWSQQQHSEHRRLPGPAPQRQETVGCLPKRLRTPRETPRRR